MHLAGSAEGLVGALEDPLRADVDPRPRRHLPEHRQPLGLEPAELVPGRPLRHEQRVRDQHARCALRASGRRRPACPTARAASRRHAAAAASGRCRAAPRAIAPPGPSRRRRRGSSGCSATSGSRLLSSIRSGASVCHDSAFSVGSARRPDRGEVPAERLDPRVQRRPSPRPRPVRSRCRSRVRRCALAAGPGSSPRGCLGRGGLVAGADPLAEPPPAPCRREDEEDRGRDDRARAPARRSATPR